MREPTTATAHRLFVASLFYLPLLFGLMLVDVRF
jgi:heme O synthase-like polyprenyltransferase